MSFAFKHRCPVNYNYTALCAFLAVKLLIHLINYSLLVLSAKHDCSGASDVFANNILFTSWLLYFYCIDYVLFTKADYCVSNLEADNEEDIVGAPASISWSTLGYN